MTGAPLSWQRNDGPTVGAAKVASGGTKNRRVTDRDDGMPGVASGEWPDFDADAVRRLGLFAYNVGRKFFPDRSDLVEEAVQETLTRTYERWERANQRGMPEAWVVNTATYVCQEKLREERRGARFSRPPVPTGADDEVVVRCELLAAALRRLTRRQRLVVVWRYLFDFSVSDTATALGLTDSKVRDASHNGVEKLRKILGDEWGDQA
jgi:RNA polymerase sigma factor (sigma-70 family)